MKQDVILQVENLCVDFQSRNGTARVISGLSFSLHHKEAFGIAGESGCGKTMTALAIMGLIPSPQGRVTDGAVFLNSENLIRADNRRLCAIRGKEISMIFQEPMTSLNPVLSVGHQIVESLRFHEGLSRKDSWDRAVELLRLVGVPSPQLRAKEYPHQMSGGMRQRIMIAIALSCSPKVLIADEPTTALDVTIQAQILDLLKELQEQTQTAIILITHDVGVLSETTEHMIIMYAGYKVEEGNTADVLHSPKHPYTKSLTACIPGLHRSGVLERSLLPEIPGIVPNSTGLRQGCAFAPRCSSAIPECRNAIPSMREMGKDHSVACWVL